MELQSILSSCKMCFAAFHWLLSRIVVERLEKQPSIVCHRGPLPQNVPHRDRRQTPLAITH